MAPNSAAVTGVLRQAVYYHLDNTSYDNALFFAERLAAHDSRSGESAFLLALSHYRLGDFRSASEISKHAGYRGIHLGCAYVFALSALALERYRDGISALEKSKGLWLNRASFGKHTSSVRSLYPDAATVYCLLGKLYRAMDDRNKAVACFEESLKLNPFMWDAFTSICDMGAAVRVPNVFRVGEQLIRNFDYDHGDTALDQKDSAPLSALEPLHRKTASRPAVQDMTDPFDSNRPAAFSDAPSLSNLMSLDTEENDFMSRITAARLRNAANHNHNPSPPPPDGTETPSGPSLNAEGANGRSAAPQEPPQAPSRRTRSVQTTDQAFTDAVPRMGYRLGARRRDNKTLDNEQSAAPEQAPSLLRTAASTLSGIDRKRTVSGHPVQARQNQADEAGAPQRRSARLNMFKPSITKNNSGAATIGAAASRELKKARPPIPRVMRPGSSGSTVGRVVSGNRKPLEDNTMDVDHNEAPRVREVPSHLGQSQAPKPSENDAAKTEEALRWIMDLMKKLASGYQHLSQFRCQEAIQCYNSLPRAHSDTPWVLAQMGRAAYEQAAYPEAEKHFRRVRVLAPSRLEDMEVYSTILWHLKRETDLSYLSHELVDSAWLSPQAWCALGNAWSLAQDHEQALRCFKRATQLNPKFAYAYTLQGHEHVSNEEYDKALTAYRHALAADRRHYNAYYGIGKVYEKLGNYEKAYTHYLTASNIHPTNAVLICCIGTILEKQKNPTQALRYFSKATDLAPRAAQTRFKKARALLILGQAEAAKEELMILKDLAPDEAQVHFLLGKLFKSLNDKQSAVRHFTVALSLDPKASSKIKEAIESLEDDDGYDDSMMH